ncbi:resistin [Rhinatrema bivittatum]|uniref:resistin n=1 Tax=Rhinatrema bivittatum TaxID=194408 RepID=UPI00112D826F|nr:resistin [Rhinatrema bivittatum]
MKAIRILLCVFLGSGFVAANPEQCTLSDLQSLDSICKSRACTAEQTCSCKLTCTDVVTKGALAVCPEDHTPISCSCGMGCGSWDVRNQQQCHCQCSGIDWTSARCCKIIASYETVGR